jgi:flagellin-specific chaperone FliS
MRFESEPAITMTSSFSKAAQAYRSVSLESRVASSTGSELVSLLFEGFLERVKLAKLAMELGCEWQGASHWQSIANLV